MSIPPTIATPNLLKNPNEENHGPITKMTPTKTAIPFPEIVFELLTFPGILF